MVWFLMGLSLVLSSAVSFALGAIAGVASTLGSQASAVRHPFEEGL